MPETALFSALLVALSIVLVVVHLRAWRKRDHGGLTDEDYRFFRGQYYRRLVTSGLIGVIGLTMLGHLALRDLRAISILWLGVLLLVGSVLVLALVDWAASRGFVKRHMAEHAKVREQLLADVQRLRKEKRHEAGE